MDEMIQQFSPERLNSSPAVFDETKLLWVNATHLRALPDQDLWARLQPFLDQAKIQLPKDPAWRERALAAFKSGMHTFKDAVEPFKHLSEAPIEISAEGRETFGWPSTPAVVQAWRDRLGAMNADYLTEAEFNGLQDGIKDALAVKGKFLFQPIRVAVIGHPQGTELKMLVPLLHRTTLIRRAEQILQAIKG
jgi:nondiscriminating glutamyl-tRNA synthetase